MERCVGGALGVGAEVGESVGERSWSRGCVWAHTGTGGAEGVGEYVEPGGYRQSLGVEVGSSRGEGGRLLVSVCTSYVKSPAVGVSVGCFDLNCYSKFGMVVLGRRKCLGLSTTGGAGLCCTRQSR